MAIRYCKISIILSVGLLFALIAANNILNYQINFTFVQHVLKMDTFPPIASSARRAIDSEFIHHGVYRLIILAEIVVATTCFMGGIKLFNSRHAPPDIFNQNKSVAIIGLTVAFLVLTTGFLTIAGEWFYLWLAPEPWSGALNSAVRLLVVTTMALLFVAQSERQ